MLQVAARKGANSSGTAAAAGEAGEAAAGAGCGWLVSSRDKATRLTAAVAR